MLLGETNGEGGAAVANQLLGAVYKESSRHLVVEKFLRSKDRNSSKRIEHITCTNITRNTWHGPVCRYSNKSTYKVCGTILVQLDLV
jgi:hypothetical protein